jgi:hypothetical protein
MPALLPIDFDIKQASPEAVGGDRQVMAGCGPCSPFSRKSRHLDSSSVDLFISRHQEHCGCSGAKDMQRSEPLHLLPELVEFVAVRLQRGEAKSVDERLVTFAWHLTFVDVPLIEADGGKV